VREALFSALGRRVHGARGLDLFAGTGALGLEAISRGAREVVFVERARRVRDILADNVRACGFEDEAEVRAGDALVALRRLSAGGDRFDLVFLDPPYDGPLLAQSLEAIAREGLLTPGGTVVCEHRRGAFVPPPPGLQISTTREYGDCALTTLRAREPDAERQTKEGRLTCR